MDLHVKSRVFAHGVELGMKSVQEKDSLQEFKSYHKIIDSKISSGMHEESKLFTKLFDAF